MKKNKLISLLTSVSLLAFLFTSCTHFDEPGYVDNPNKTFSESPVVSGINPSDSAVAGVREIIINGQNFVVNGKGNDTNWVYIGSKAAEIKSVSANQIVVYRPATFGSSLDIKVVIPSAESIAQIKNYKIEEPVITFSDFRFQAYDLTAVEVDNQENLFIATRREIWKLTPDGINLTRLVSLSSTFAKITDMKLGPGGLLYVLVGKKDLYTINPSTGEDVKYITIPVNSDRLDFDANQNIYVGRRDGIYVINSDKTVTSTGKYDGAAVVELRVMGGALYTATASQLWKNPILDDKGSLGDDQQVVDLTGTTNLASCTIKSFNFNNDGKIILCLSGDPSYSLFVLEDDGTVAPYYKEKILPLSVDQIIYGSGRYMYLNRGSLPRDSVRMFRMGMDKVGAPYLGRQF